ncbi:transcriptional regulator [Streptomyces sp. Ru62]|nr:transcriptional regulator [Streptomyces sp. Ru62]
MEELAESSGVSVRAISDMERGRSRVPQRRTVAALAQGLGLAEADRQTLLSAARLARPTRAEAVTGSAVPPRSVRDFTGRATELERLRQAAETADTTGDGSVWVLWGPPGCGKTTLALKAAAELTERFPDGCFVVDLHGVEGPVAPTESALRLLKALGVSDRRLAEEDAQGHTGLLRALLAERQCLVVLDNARDEGQVRPLLPATGRSLVLVTSRWSLSGLEAVDRLALTEMTQTEAVQLLRRILGEERADAEVEAVARVAALCGGLPLALRVAGNWLTVRSGWRVTHLVRRLADEEHRLRALAAGDVRVEAAFMLSYRQLTRQAARMLRLLGLVTGPDMTAAYGAALTGTTVFEAAEVMDELVEAGLLQTSFTGRYQLHDLLRLFARARLTEEDEPADRRTAEDRLRTWLLDTAVIAGRWFEPGYGAPPPSWQGLVPLDNAEQARAWLQNEAAAWLAALRTTAARDEHTRVVETAEAMHWFSDLWVYWGHWPEVFHLSSQAAAALDDPRLRATHLNYHAWALGTCQHNHRRALEQLEQALKYARRTGDTAQQAWTVAYTAGAHKRLGEVQQAADKSLAAVALFEAAGDHEGWLQATGIHGDCLRLLGRGEEALVQHGRIAAFLDAPDCPIDGYVARSNRAHAASALGSDYAALGRWREAAEHHRAALVHAQHASSGFAEGFALTRLGEALLELGETEEARSCLSQVVALGNAAHTKDLATARTLLDSLR